MVIVKFDQNNIEYRIKYGHDFIMRARTHAHAHAAHGLDIFRTCRRTRLVHVVHGASR